MKFSFFAYGILAVAALALFLYFLGNTPQFEMSTEATQPLLYIGAFIVVAFVVYMFYKRATH